MQQQRLQGACRIYNAHRNVLTQISLFFFFFFSSLLFCLASGTALNPEGQPEQGVQAVGAGPWLGTGCGVGRGSWGQAPGLEKRLSLSPRSAEANISDVFTIAKCFWHTSTLLSSAP